MLLFLMVPFFNVVQILPEREIQKPRHFKEFCRLNRLGSDL